MRVDYKLRVGYLVVGNGLIIHYAYGLHMGIFLVEIFECVWVCIGECIEGRIVEY
jgi:hypothetical protein